MDPVLYVSCLYLIGYTGSHYHTIYANAYMPTFCCQTMYVTCSIERGAHLLLSLRYFLHSASREPGSSSYCADLLPGGVPCVITLQNHKNSKIYKPAHFTCPPVNTIFAAQEDIRQLHCQTQQIHQT